MFSIRKKSGIIRKKSGILRPSAHGVKTKRGSRVYVDTPDIGVKLLLDDIHQLIIENMSQPFTYSIRSYDNE